MHMPIRLLIVDDHVLICEGLRSLLEDCSSISVVGYATNGLTALSLVEELKPDVVLMDIAMPEMDGLEATKHFQAQYPEIKVLILSMHHEQAYVETILKSGARGYLTKNNANEAELIRAITTVFQGGIHIDAQASSDLFTQATIAITTPTPPPQVLSARELEILKRLVQGHANKVIARELRISDRTVETHRANIHRKLGIKTTADLVRYAYLHHLL